MRRFSSTYVLLGIVLLLFAAIRFFDNHFQSTDERLRSEKKVFKFDYTQIDQLTLTNPSGTFVLEKKKGVWTILHPIEIEAESQTVDEILADLGYLEARRVIAYSEMEKKEATLKEWGLETPTDKVVVRENGKTHELLLGRKTVVSDVVYARTSEEKESPVYILGGSIKTLLEKNLSDLRSHAVFSFKSGDVVRLGLRQSTGEGQVIHETELAKADGGWVLEKPLAARAETGKVQQLIENLAHLRASQFVADDTGNLNAYGLTTPSAQVWIAAGPKKEESTLLIGGPVQGKEEVYAKNLKSNAVFTLPKNTVNELIDGIPNARDRHIVALSPESVTGFTIEEKGKSLEFKKDGIRWFMESASLVRANPAKVAEFLSQLAGAEATDIVKDAATDLKSYGLDKPSLTISLKQPKPGTESASLLFGKAQANSVLVKNSLESSVYSLPVGFLNSISRDPLAWRDPQVLDLDKTKITTLTFGTTSGSTSLQRTGPGKFTSNLSGQVIDGVKAEAQASLLAELHATRWMGANQPAYGLNKPSLQITIDAGAQVTLTIGNQLADSGYAAQINGQNDVFEISESDFDLLDRIPTASVPVTAAAPSTSPH